MNRIVASWQRSQERRSKIENAPDGLSVGEDPLKVLLPMAERKKPETKPQVTKQERALAKSSIDVDRKVYKLTDAEFAKAVKAIKESGLDSVSALRTATWNNLRRLGVSRDASKAVRKIPAASAQRDFRSIIDWAEGIKATDKESVAQLVALDATAHVRVKGW